MKILLQTHINRTKLSSFRLPAIFATALALTCLPAHAALILKYNFNEGTGTTTADTSGASPAANGTFEGSAAWSSTTPSGSGFSVSLPGVNAANSVNGGVSSKFDTLSQLTLVTWINLQAAPTGGDRLLSNLSTGAGFDFIIQAPNIGTIATNNYSLAANLDNGAYSNTADITQGGWVFVALTYDGTISTNNVNFYWGTTSNSVAQLGATGTVNVGTLGNSVNPFYVGNTALTTADRSPNALFDNVQIYNTVLDGIALESVRAAAIPEPATWALLAATGTFFMVMRRRRRN